MNAYDEYKSLFAELLGEVENQIAKGHLSITFPAWRSIVTADNVLGAALSFAPEIQKFVDRVSAHKLDSKEAIQVEVDRLHNDFEMLKRFVHIDWERVEHTEVVSVVVLAYRLCALLQKFVC
jgi:hypothetical protein